jgi:DNA-binding transcriptional regulator YhcF (GntR family)
MNAVHSRTSWISDDSRIPKYRQVINFLLWEIEQGVYKAGDRIPSINETSEGYYLSRDTVEKAYRELCLRGILTSIPGKGFFLNDRKGTRTLKVLMIFNKFSNYKRIIYNTMMEKLGKKATSTVFVHDHDEQLFESMVLDNLGLYDYYVVMPHFYGNDERVHQYIEKIPANRLIILDKDTQSTRKHYGLIYQDFANDLREALHDAKAHLDKYQQLFLVYPTAGRYPHEIKTGFEYFCRDAKIKGQIITSEELRDPEKGEAFVVVGEDDLIDLVQRAREGELRLGKDVGIVSYNDTPMKRVLEGGITVISTDHAYMGQLAAEMILTGKHQRVHNPFSLILRESL